MSRRVATVLVIGAVAVVVVTTGLVAELNGSSGARVASYAGSQPPTGIAMSDFTLRSNDGRLVHSAQLRGAVTLLTFLDSQCTESCPVIAWTVARTLDALSTTERKGVRAVAISADPEEDTPRAVRRFLARNRAVGRLEYLGGGQPASELRPVWSAFMVLSSLESGEDALHSAPVRIYDRDGEWVATLHAGADLTEANLAHDIRLALTS